MGTALQNLKKQHRGIKLSTIGGAGRLTNTLIDSLQNYYGFAIKENKGDLAGMIKAVQATLLHFNSTNEQPRHHLCPISWCKWQQAKKDGKEKEYDHKYHLPSAIVQLVRPIYARLGNKSLLEKCIGGFTQNANESLHHLVWQFCPKEVFLGVRHVEIACALAVMCFNDGASSLASISSALKLKPTPMATRFLRRKDLRSVYDSTDRAKKMRKRRRRIRKGMQDLHEQREGVVYAAGAFDAGGPDPNNPTPSSSNDDNLCVFKIMKLNSSLYAFFTLIYDFRIIITVS